jgi:hypothetical protein
MRAALSLARRHILAGLGAVLLALFASAACEVRPQPYLTGPEQPPVLVVDASPPPAPPARASILLYVIGSDLEREINAASKNLAELEASKRSERLSVWVETGGTNKQGWREPRRFVLRPAGLQEIDPPAPQPGMGESASLASFIRFVRGQRPTDRLHLVLWSHGAGPNVGIGPDEVGAPESRRLTLSRMQEALRASLDGNKLEFIGFDACLMGNLEVASSLEPFARFMGASEDIEPGAGWDWKNWVSFLSERPEATGGEVGAEIGRTFLAKLATLQQDEDATFSTIDLAKVPALRTATARLGSELSLALETPEGWPTLAKARALAYDFHSLPLTNNGFDLVDFDDLTRTPGLPVSEGLRADLQSALRAAVVANSVGSRRSFAKGLTLFFPTFTVEVDTYARLPQPLPKAYQTFVGQFAAAQRAQQLTMPIRDVRLDGTRVRGNLPYPYFSEVYAALFNANGEVVSLKPAAVNGTEVSVDATETWPHVSGVPVLMLRDRAYFATAPETYGVLGFADTGDRALFMLRYSKSGDQYAFEDASKLAIGTGAGAKRVESRSGELAPGSTLAPAALTVDNGLGSLRTVSGADKIRANALGLTWTRREGDIGFVAVTYTNVTVVSRRVSVDPDPF